MKYALFSIFFALLIIGCGKKDEGRPEFGGKSAQAFYSSFETRAVDCDKPQAKIAHQRLNYNGRDYFDLPGGDEMDVYLYFVGSQFRMEFERTSYSYGGRYSLFKSASHDRESISGYWYVSGKKMALMSHGLEIAEFGDGGPVDDHDTMVGQVLPVAQTFLKLSAKEVISKPVRVIGITDDVSDQSTQSLACGGHIADAVNVR